MGERDSQCHLTELSNVYARQGMGRRSHKPIRHHRAAEAALAPPPPWWEAEETLDTLLCRLRTKKGEGGRPTPTACSGPASRIFAEAMRVPGAKVLQVEVPLHPSWRRGRASALLPIRATGRGSACCSRGTISEFLEGRNSFREESNIRFSEGGPANMRQSMDREKDRIPQHNGRAELPPAHA